MDQGEPQEVQKEKHKVLPLGKNSPLHQYKLGADQLEISLAEEDVAVLVDKLTAVSPCSHEG